MNYMHAILNLTLKSSVHLYNSAKKILLVIVILFAGLTMFQHLLRFEKIPVDLTFSNEIKMFEEQKKSLATSEESIESNLQMNTFLLSTCSIVGMGCEKDGADVTISENSLISTFSSVLAAPYEHPPASGVVWLTNSLEKIGFIPASYASKGSGFSAIEGYQHVWELFRQIAYLLLVLVMIILGFLIMFRVKLNAQTVISIESALPRIIVSMILITFSFAIAGFLIDLMYVIMALGIYLVFETGLSTNTSATTVAETIGRYQNAGFGELWLDEAGNLFTLGNSIWNLIPQVLRIITSGLLFGIGMSYTKLAASIPAMIFNAFSGIHVEGSFAGFGGGGSPGNTPQMGTVVIWAILLAIILTVLPGFILGLFIALTVISFMFKIFFILLTSYIKVILYTVFAPIILMIGAVPGVNITGWWFKNLAGELAMFPSLTFLLLIGRAILTANMNGGGFSATWFGTAVRTSVSPSPNPFELPFLSGFSAVDFNTVIGVGIILLAPDFLKMVKGVFGVGDSIFKFGLGTFLGGAGAVSGGLGLYNQVEGWKGALIGTDPYKPRKGLFSSFLPKSLVEGLGGVSGQKK